MKRVVKVVFIFLFITTSIGSDIKMVFADYEDVDDPKITDPYDNA